MYIMSLFVCLEELYHSCSPKASVGKDLLLRSQHTDGRTLFVVERLAVISLRF